MPLQRFQGHVTCGIVAAKSKSEHTAVQLVTSDNTYLLRRPGGHPFQDPKLKALVGKDINATGVLKGNILFVTKWDQGS
jgi:hypothetical protein